MTLLVLGTWLKDNTLRLKVFDQDLQEATAHEEAAAKKDTVQPEVLSPQPLTTSEES